MSRAPTRSEAGKVPDASRKRRSGSRSARRAARCVQPPREPGQPPRQDVQHQARAQVHAGQRARPVVRADAADERHRAHAARQARGAGEREGPATGDAEQREALDRRAGRRARRDPAASRAGAASAARPRARSPGRSTAIRQHVALERSDVRDPALEARAERAVQVEHRQTVCVAERREAQLSAVAQAKRAVDGRGVALGHSEALPWSNVPPAQRRRPTPAHACPPARSL